MATDITAETVHLRARAKINLALHVTGQRRDGYHELDSLVAFADIANGDRLTVTYGSATIPRLTIDGPFAGSVPHGSDNIVVRAAEACGGIAAVHLHKGLPVASGIGGGSADAAAVLQAALARGDERETLMAIALELGADVPVCVAGRPCRMAGIGEVLTPAAMPAIPAILVNPGVPVETKAVFAHLAEKRNAPLPPLPVQPDLATLVDWLGTTRNDLEAPAIAYAPAIAAVIEAAGAMPGCRFARMSGSGATVFALFANAAERDAALPRLAEAGEGWWIAPGEIEPSAA
ncbi:4-(cytidine 5'-diphospho)-2-C-methyl-D-erythritol kinase [Acuticoccus sp. M5D2P5]|uniref:4-(cytidine 5'-diphospho)-2-C-methyl-D-erythritol kinase n=1 Tax=Acuticoccus kalidii TaxID=2910977 RepID=UPI001F3CA161|nr:4-(cytidine 5'-diphospho)-2-C-methyl-D-erythritol kinase [Acuticoccus kalidii]MCF3936087.1 4-(cytidine 5'-diphospho)-2-C-methyl-D-erythritol kinase [Acuticoccus kalidii]